MIVANLAVVDMAAGMVEVVMPEEDKVKTLRLATTAAERVTPRTSVVKMVEAAAKEQEIAQGPRLATTAASLVI